MDAFLKEGKPQVPVTVFHGAAPDKAEILRDMILQQAPETEIRMETVGPVIGIYAGSGCAGIAFTKRETL